MPSSAPLSQQYGARSETPARPLGLPTHLLLGQGQQLLLGLLHLLSRPADGDLVDARALGGEVDVHASALLHDGAHEAPLGADQGVVELGGDGHLQLRDVGLEDAEGREGG